MPSSNPTTARELLAVVRSFGPLVEGTDLTFVTDLPEELDVVLRVLHTGVRAALTGRRWWGSTSEKPRVIELSPADLVPDGVTLLAVEGDERWDRVPIDARLDFPTLFVVASRK